METGLVKDDVNGSTKCGTTVEDFRKHRHRDISKRRNKFTNFFIIRFSPTF